jgi:hypothetical protein
MVLRDPNLTRRLRVGNATGGVFFLPGSAAARTLAGEGNEEGAPGRVKKDESLKNT